MKNTLSLLSSIISKRFGNDPDSSSKQKALLERGFTFTELVIVIGILGILISLSTFSLSRFQTNTSVVAVTEEIIAELNLQQQKAMAGATEGGADHAFYGVHFDADQYVLFKGGTYNPTEPTNSVFPLDPSVQITDIQLPGGTVIFNKISGDFVGFSAGANTITIEHLGSGEQKVITINRYGVISQVQ